ncbi:UNVERIFIED_CONTAM: hypothetical protein K2H54_006248 [Gekko kuhli]
MEHSTSLMLTRASRPEPQSQLNTTLMLHAEADRPLGSTTPMTSSSKNFGEPLSTSSAGNMDLPSEAVKNLTSLRAGSHRFLITQVSRKNPSEIQHMPPTTVSDLLTFSTVKDLKESTAANYPYSEAIPALPRATETSSYAVNGTLAKVSKSPVSSPVPPRASVNRSLFCNCSYEGPSSHPDAHGKEHSYNSAVVSDDACGSGNYTSEMSLRRAGGQPPSHPDSFLALIVLQSNRSRPTLRVKSCCVTPTARPTGLDAACCLFPRTPLECRYIQLQPNDEPQTASFTIQLFRMLNHSVAYLHCELSICLNNHPGCEQRCSESRETHFKPRDQSSYQTLHNLISFGPVLKAQHEFPSEVAAGSEQAMMFPVLLGSLAGTAVLLGISIFIWFHQRSKIKTEADLEGLCTP